MYPDYKSIDYESENEIDRDDEMSRPEGYIFVLWGDKFDEVAAVIFVTELRKAGFLVRLVGLTPPQIKGRHGLGLVPDLMLEQALPKAAQAICVIIPCPAYQVKHFKNDPRVSELFDQAHSNKAQFVIGQFNTNTRLYLDSFEIIDIVEYPDNELTAFVRELINTIPRR